MALAVPFRLNTASFTRKAAPFAVAAMVGFSSMLAQAADGAKPTWSALKTKPDFATAEKTPIPTKHCNYLFDRLTDAMEESGKGKSFVSKTTRKSLVGFYAFNEKGLPTCSGPREIAWETESDRAAIGALADSAYLAFSKKTDFIEVYGFRPALRPTVAPGPGADAGAPKVN